MSSLKHNTACKILLASTIVNALMWWSGLTVLLVHWLISGHEQFFSADIINSHLMVFHIVPFISDLGSKGLGHTLFVLNCALHALLFTTIASISSILRCAVAASSDRRLYISSLLLSVSALFSQTFLLLLAVKDSKSYPQLHFVALGLFLLGGLFFVAFDLISMVLFYTGHEFPLTYTMSVASEKTTGTGSAFCRPHTAPSSLLKSTIFYKVLWILVALSLIVIFGIMVWLSYNIPAAYIEWTLALWYPLYDILLVWDIFRVVNYILRTGIDLHYNHPQTDLTFE
ncbi:hypothetical protein CANCADRAFT_45886 [Tortispora caseinolytica NRRL Y-17796]|uniref:CWH43-like N-terminal domain-containing protein n=1 Tax=Tortispora caseinolytica NRRL Y-17796 TaxID=767744 RepID=A0A1E4TCI8_9ASCO|nr:hypothetical protein CANCADRAFT_45886 [Tortispora caseinolytica NRRL Y-17796]